MNPFEYLRGLDGLDFAIAGALIFAVGKIWREGEKFAKLNKKEEPTMPEPQQAENVPATKPRTAEDNDYVLFWQEAGADFTQCCNENSPTKLRCTKVQGHARTHQATGCCREDGYVPVFEEWS